MDGNKMDYMEDMLFKYIDEFKILFLPEQWVSVFLDCSKNEILALLLLYRHREVNMSEVAEYIVAPLNTATGVIARLEKKELVQRMRDAEDKRIVKISLTSKGRAYFEEEKRLLMRYFERFMESLTKEEEQALFSCMLKLLKVLKSEGTKEEQDTQKKVRKIIIE